MIIDKSFTKIQSWIERDDEEFEVSKKRKRAFKIDEEDEAARESRVLSLRDNRSLKNTQSLDKEIINQEATYHTSDISVSSRADSDINISYIDSNVETNSSDNHDFVFNDKIEELDINTECSETVSKNDFDDDAFCDNENNNFNSFVDDVTDDEYDVDSEEIETIVWRHIVFHIIRNSESARFNILLIKITLLHTKSENRKSRM